MIFLIRSVRTALIINRKPAKVIAFLGSLFKKCFKL